MNRLTMHIFLQDTDERCRTELSRLLRDAGHRVQASADPGEAPGIFRAHHFALSFIALDLTAEDHAALFRQLKEQSPHTLMIVTTRCPSIDSTIAALRLGVFDYLILSGSDREQVLKMIERAGKALSAMTEQRTDLIKMKEIQGALQNAHGKLINGHADDPAELYFHGYFEETIALELVRAKRYQASLSLISLRLDFFVTSANLDADPIYQRHVAAVAALLKRRLRCSDKFFRSKIDEFLIILPETPKDGAWIVVDRVNKALAELVVPLFPTAVSSRLFFLGIATFPQDGTEGPELLRFAHNNFFGSGLLNEQSRLTRPICH